MGSGRPSALTGRRTMETRTELRSGASHAAVQPAAGSGLVLGGQDGEVLPGLGLDSDGAQEVGVGGTGGIHDLQLRNAVG